STKKLSPNWKPSIRPSKKKLCEVGETMKFELEKHTSRDIYGDLMLDLAREDEKVVGVTGDSQMMMRMTKMAKEFPNRVFNVGIAEQNAMNMAAGMAATGYKPFVAGFAPFMTMRAC